MAPTTGHGRAADARSAPRSSFYLAATLYCDGCSSSVKIRNMSSTGALVEGTEIPELGSIIQLVRGELIAHGIVTRSDADHCGLKFSGRVNVEQWRATPTNKEQQRVDEIVRLVKAGAVPLPVPALSRARRDQAGANHFERSEDLRRAWELLDKLSAALAGDPEIVTRNGSALQYLDIAMQIIAAVKDAAIAEDDPETGKLLALRTSADQALEQA